MYAFSVYLCWIGVCVYYVSVSVTNFNNGTINDISVFAVLSTQFPHFEFHFIKLYICIDQSWTLQHTCTYGNHTVQESVREKGEEEKNSEHRCISHKDL